MCRSYSATRWFSSDQLPLADLNPLDISLRNKPMSRLDRRRGTLTGPKERNIICSVERSQYSHCSRYWVSDLPFTIKYNHKLDMYLEPKLLNLEVCQTYHCILCRGDPTRLCVSTVFSKLEAKYGYWGIVLDQCITNHPTLPQLCHSPRY